MKEGVALYMHGAPDAYRGFIQERNSAIARDIAGYLGLPFKGEVAEKSNGVDYLVPASTLSTAEARKLGVSGEHDFYGGFVDHIQQVGKSILHPSSSRNAPEFYSHEFSEEIGGLVLPGVTTFSKAEIIRGFQSLASRNIEARLKMPSESDGNGQSVIKSEEDLTQKLKDLDDKCLREHGIVLEQNLQDIRTISVGRAQIGSEMYSFIAHQKDGSGKQNEEINGSFLGASLRVVRGGLNNLNILKDLDIDDHEAVEGAWKFDALYNKFMKPVSSRMSYDYLIGSDRYGARKGGITDITARLGGNCPALMVAIDKLKSDRSLSSIATRVDLLYNPGSGAKDNGEGKIYLNHPKLRISARLV